MAQSSQGALNDELITSTERRMDNRNRTASTHPTNDYSPPLFLPHAPPIFGPNPRQNLLYHASDLCQRIENVVESESTRSLMSIGNLGVSEESGYYQYPWRVQDVYVEYDETWEYESPGECYCECACWARGMDVTICIVELTAVDKGLLWYEHSNELASLCCKADICKSFSLSCFWSFGLILRCMGSCSVVYRPRTRSDTTGPPRWEEPWSSNIRP
ncbi:hypothetical protein BDW75DRAFT_216786 [Aspergillus navahoensis]